MLKNNAKIVCEKILIDRKMYNLDNSILPSENILIDKILSRYNEMAHVYNELVGKYSELEIRVFFDAVLTIAIFWSPEQSKRVRESKKQLVEINAQIANLAEEVAELLEKRQAIQSASSLWSGTYYHVCDVIEKAAINNGLFNSNVSEKLELLTSQFDLKYWPQITDFMHVLADDAKNSEITVCDSLTEVAISGTRASLTDYFKAFFCRIEEEANIHGGQLPVDFDLSNKSWATLANCTLDLPADAMIDEDYMRRLKQRLKEEASKKNNEKEILNI